MKKVNTEQLVNYLSKKLDSVLSGILHAMQMPDEGTSVISSRIPDAVNEFINSLNEEELALYSSFAEISKKVEKSGLEDRLTQVLTSSMQAIITEYS